MRSSIARSVSWKARSRRLACGAALSGLPLILGCTGLQNAIAEGDTRTISLHHLHTGEDLTVTYKINGRYDEAALQKLNYELRDWRRNETIRMDPRLVDLVWEAARDVGATQPIQVVCGYRAPETNAMLRRRSSGVAQFSQHTLGKAMDFYIPGVPLATLRAAGLRLERGGVGYYPTSGSPFVHMDVGSIRYWPRMPREELVRIFPDEKTVYLPADGRPLRNYALALAEVQRRGSTPSANSLAAARDAGIVTADAGGGSSGGSMLARLFSFGHKDDDEDESADAAPAPAPAAHAAPAAAQAHPALVATVTYDKNVPLPRSKPQATYQVASADSTAGVAPSSASSAQQPAPARPAQAASLVQQAKAQPQAAASTANAVIAERGYWEGAKEQTADEAALAGQPAAQPRGRFMTAAAATAAALKQAVGMRRAYADTLPPDPSTTAAVRAETSNMVFAYADAPGTPEVGTFGHGLSAVPGEIPATAPTAATVPPTAPIAPTANVAKVVSPDTTVAVKNSITRPLIAAEKAAALRAAVRSGERFEEPWLRSLMIAPDSRGSMTTALIGPLDYASLTPFLRKPGSAVMLTFGSDPELGLSADRFSGDAVVFISTLTFAQQTASLN